MSYFCCSLKSTILKSVIDISSTSLYVDMDPLSVSINGFIPSVVDMSNIQINLDISNNELVRTVSYMQDVSNNIHLVNSVINDIITDISNQQIIANEVSTQISQLSQE